MKKLLFLNLLLLNIAVRAYTSQNIIQGGTTSIFQPVYAADTANSKALSIINQQIRIDVFQGYAVVRADYWFNNSSDKEVSFPAGFHSCNKAAAGCDEFYWLRIMVNSGAPFAAHNIDSVLAGKLVAAGDRTSAFNLTFIPGVTEISVNYGIKTAGALLITGRDSISGNAFRYIANGYQWWDNGENKGDLWIRMNGGYTTKDVIGLLPDKMFMGGNTVLHAYLKDVLNNSSDAVLLWYPNIDSTPASLSQVSWETQFYKVNGWKVNEKIMATLVPFSANDFEGKDMNKEAKKDSSLLTWSAIGGGALISIFLLLFIYAEKRRPA